MNPTARKGPHKRSNAFLAVCSPDRVSVFTRGGAWYDPQGQVKQATSCVEMRSDRLLIYSIRLVRSVKFS